jgi:hypothetical protein
VCKKFENDKIELYDLRLFEVSIDDAHGEISRGSANQLWRRSHAGARYESSRIDESVETRPVAGNIPT